MKFTPGLEAEDSFMIIPNEFVRDHELTQEEITASMTPDPEYERMINVKYGWGQKMTVIERMAVIERIKRFMSKNRSEKIFALKTRLNRLLGRKLSSIWKARVPDYCSSNQSSVWKTRGIPDSYSV